MPKAHRLRRRDFPKRFEKRVVGDLLSLSVSRAARATVAFTCVVSKKTLPRAVDRNRLKRRCREIFRPLISQQQPMLIVVHPKKSALDASYTELSREAGRLLGKISA